MDSWRAEKTYTKTKGVTKKMEYDYPDLTFNIKNKLDSVLNGQAVMFSRRVY
jgi:hypothetical protein